MQTPIDTVFVARSDAAATVLSRCLAHAGHIALRADDGEHALGLVLRHRPRACVLDTDMPGLTAFDVARELKADAATARIRVVVLNARAQLRERLAWLDDRRIGTCAKPVQAIGMLRDARTEG